MRCSLVLAAMCSAFACGSHDRWPLCLPRIGSRSKARIRRCYGPIDQAVTGPSATGVRGDRRFTLGKLIAYRLPGFNPNVVPMLPDSVRRLMASRAFHAGVLLFVMAVAHGTQFAYNVPVAIRNRRGAGVWQVRGLMLFIFITDFVLMTANGVLAVIYFS